MTHAPADTRTRLQRRTLILLSVAQILSGIAAGSIVSVGSLIAVDLTGSDAWAGSVTTANTLGAALASLILAQLAAARGRRPALAGGLAIAALGATSVIAAAVTGQLLLLLLGGALMGFGSAVNLQARFAATDLAAPRTRSRDLSIVVWMSTVGAVTGPNLIAFAEAISQVTGLPLLAAAFAPPIAGLLAAVAVLGIGLRPDPLLLSREHEGALDPAWSAASTPQPVPDGAASSRGRFTGLSRSFAALRGHPRALAALIAILAAHAVMVAVMSMTPVHMEHHGATLQLVGLTVSLHIAGMYALAPVMGLLADRLGPPAVLVGGLAVLILAVALSGASGANAALTTAGLILLGLGWSAATVAGAAMIAASVTGPERVAVQGLADSLMSLAGAAGGALAGVGLAVVGYGGLNAAGGAVAALAIVAVLAVLRRPRVAP
ncbi:MFS transporter [Serinibacter salmoneus]|uniref:Putative MFS family arabinose efflux permease n=1 Tax=Serinibacter salmoneus TaxID=556530 RepID=A0A2A9CW89_9MICO|nr:MFS transporter [Serinibacter salmoneus]PFG18698.1 putative MFS family arabinose efflux permease [Serinibacter salmoneus]